MPELRQDPISGQWVIVAPRRAERPNDFRPGEGNSAAQPCPFCAGNEAETPPETLAYRDRGSPPQSPDWRVRVVPNKFPALNLAAGELATEKLAGGLSPFVPQPGRGAHEVIIESPRHVTRASDLSPQELAEVLSAYRDRLAYWQDHAQLAYALLFKNVGAAAGASLEHLHSQLLVLPVVPPQIVQQISATQQLWLASGECPYCRLLADELAGGERVVCDNPQFVAFCPFASRFPFETWIFPKLHANHFQHIAHNPINQLADIMHRVLRGIESLAAPYARQPVAYNYVLHTFPLDASSFDTSAAEHYHWHFEVTPRLSNIAGLEIGTGCFINPVPPEQAAAILRITDK